MWKIILLVVLPLSINANIEEFTGRWTPVALFPSVIFLPMCYELSFTYAPQNCTCADGKKTEVLEVRRILDEKISEEGKTVYPTLVVDNATDVTGSLNVTCTCGDKVYPNRVIAKSVSNNYFVLYKPQDIIKSEPNGALLYARQVPNYATLLNVMKDIKDLNARSGGVLCSTEFLKADFLSKAKLQQNGHLNISHTLLSFIL